MLLSNHHDYITFSAFSEHFVSLANETRHGFNFLLLCAVVSHFTSNAFIKIPVSDSGCSYCGSVSCPCSFHLIYTNQKRPLSYNIFLLKLRILYVLHGDSIPTNLCFKFNFHIFLSLLFVLFCRRYIFMNGNTFAMMRSTLLLNSLYNQKHGMSFHVQMRFYTHFTGSIKKSPYLFAPSSFHSFWYFFGMILVFSERRNRTRK